MIGWNGNKFTSLASDNKFLIESFHQEVGNIYLSLIAKNSEGNHNSVSSKIDNVNDNRYRLESDISSSDIEKGNADRDWHLLQSFCPDLLYEHIRCAISKESRGETHANNQHDENETGAPQILCNYFFGVCMIADISGFTNLSSSLCKKGKSGLDKLHLNTKGFIGQLVDMVYYYGGDGK